MAHQEAARRKCFGDPKPSMLINEISKLTQLQSKTQ